jgi:hypothetical protein
MTAGAAPAVGGDHRAPEIAVSAAAAAFRDAVLLWPLERVVRELVFTGTPYVFKANPADAELLALSLGKALRVDSSCIRVVGSAQTGFSLHPEKFGAMFNAGSDVDIVVVSERLFDKVWLCVADWYHPYRISESSHLRGEAKTWISEVRKQLTIGRVDPKWFRSIKAIPEWQKLKPLQRLSASWFSGFRGLSRTSRLAAEYDVSGLLYRTWSHALCYHVYGLDVLRRRWRDGQQGVPS